MLSYQLVPLAEICSNVRLLASTTTLCIMTLSIMTFRSFPWACNIKHFTDVPVISACASCGNLLKWVATSWCHNTQQNDTHHNNIQIFPWACNIKLFMDVIFDLAGPSCGILLKWQAPSRCHDTQHNDTQHNYIQILSWA